ncbi:50S ribosomal protein L13 [Candidatus Parcubacteria bacterium A4]|nr:MAG: 50S ribosomal protein L13 [Candidatus Parcubacteria bacterium A4]
METKREIHIIDAADKILGRLATHIAVLLRGKNKRGFMPNFDMGDFVDIKNVDKIKFSGDKINQKGYFRHSGYLGSEKHIPLKELFSDDPKEVLRLAVIGMLPKNKLKAKQIKRLRFI